MQGYWYDQRIVGHHLANGLCHPMTGGVDNVMSVAMLQRQNQLSACAGILKYAASLSPWSGHPQAVITGFARIAFALQRRAAFDAGQSRNKGRIAPTGSAKTCVALNQTATAQAPWRVDDRK